MKTPSEDLWKLIHSLNISEKGYFVKFAKRHSPEKENNYIRLFDAISNQSEKYDENDLKSKFKNEKFINSLPQQKIIL
jgi:hypothetical protein